MRSGYVRFCSASGPGVNVRLQESQRHSWAISSFFLRVPRRVSERPPQCGQASGYFAVSGTRALLGMTGIRTGGGHPTMNLTNIEKRRDRLGRLGARKLEIRTAHVGLSVAHEFRQLRADEGAR